MKLKIKGGLQMGESMKFTELDQDIAEAEKGDRGSGTCEFGERLINTQGTEQGAAAYQKDHNSSRHQPGFIQ